MRRILVFISPFSGTLWQLVATNLCEGFRPACHCSLSTSFMKWSHINYFIQNEFYCLYLASDVLGIAHDYCSSARNCAQEGNNSLSSFVLFTDTPRLHYCRQTEPLSKITQGQSLVVKMTERYNSLTKDVTIFMKSATTVARMFPMRWVSSVNALSKRPTDKGPQFWA